MNDLYQKIENVIAEHIAEHKQEIVKAKQLRDKLDTARCNDKNIDVAADGYSVHYYDYTRNDPNRPNPFGKTPDYTELPE